MPRFVTTFLTHYFADRAPDAVQHGA
jgi:hypothetical protein